jgi:hypothetical protein
MMADFIGLLVVDGQRFIARASFDLATAICIIANFL